MIYNSINNHSQFQNIFFIVIQEKRENFIKYSVV